MWVLKLIIWYYSWRSRVRADSKREGLCAPRRPFMKSCHRGSSSTGLFALAKTWIWWPLTPEVLEAPCFNDVLKNNIFCVIAEGWEMQEQRVSNFRHSEFNTNYSIVIIGACRKLNWRPARNDGPLFSSIIDAASASSLGLTIRAIA